MGKKDEIKIDELMAKVLSGNASLEEENALSHWVSESSNNQKLVEKSTRVWNADQRLFQSIDLQNDLRIMKLRIKNLKMEKRLTFYRRFIQIAAVFLFLIGVSAFLITQIPTSSQEYLTFECKSPEGRVVECVLSDGTKLWLNSETTINFSVDKDSRKLKLDGEAYFQVARNVDKPFYVDAKTVSLKVLGTSFNVKAYKEQAVVETTLDEGLVEVTQAGTKMLLEPGEQIVANTQQLTLEKNLVNAGDYSLWRDGILVFRNHRLEDIILKLESIYNVDIEIQDETIKEIYIRGMFDTQSTLESALQKLTNITNLNYVISGDQVLIVRANENP